MDGTEGASSPAFMAPLHRSCETSHGRIAPFDSLDQDSRKMIPRFMVAALCVLGPLTCAAQGPAESSEVTYISFSVAGALGTHPTGINASMVVTGYYYVTPTLARGFLREADGTITTFDVAGAIWTEPDGINAAGNITGFYELVAGVPQGFPRYADGHIITFDPSPAQKGMPLEAQPVSISDFDAIAGNYPFPLAAPSVFTRSGGGVFNTSGPHSVQPTGQCDSHQREGGPWWVIGGTPRHWAFWHTQTVIGHRLPFPLRRTRKIA
jgi:hypothetical protein